MTSNEKIELQSYRSRRKLQFSDKFYLHRSSYKKLQFFENELNPIAVWYGGWECTVLPLGQGRSQDSNMGGQSAIRGAKQAIFKSKWTNFTEFSLIFLILQWWISIFLEH
jgi:hypothetical protein